MIALPNKIKQHQDKTVRKHSGIQITKKHGSLFQSSKRLQNKLLNEKCKFSPRMIIFAKRLIERPTEWTLYGIVRYPKTLSLSNHRKNSRPNSNIHGCGLTKKIVNMKCITKGMNRNAKCKHVCFQSNTFTLYIVCRLSNNQTTKKKCKLVFKGTSVKKTKDFV